MRWLPAASVGYTTEVQLFVAPNDAALLAPERLDYLATLDLNQSHRLVLLQVVGELTKSQVSVPETTRAVLRSEAAKEGLELSPGFRSTALYEHSSNGVRGVFELVPSG